MQISFVDENDFVKEEKWYFLLYTMRSSGEIDVLFRLKLKSSIDISQPMPSLSLSVPLFSLGMTYYPKMVSNHGNGRKNANICNVTANFRVEARPNTLNLSNTGHAL